MKKVEYMGQIFEVPDWARFIMQGHGHTVYAFEKHPTKTIESGRHVAVGNHVTGRYIQPC